MEQGRQCSQTRTVNAAVTFRLDLHLRATQNIGKRLHLIHPLLVIGQTSYHEWVIVVSIEKLVFGVTLGLGVENGAVDTLAAVLFVNKALVGIDDHHEVIVVRNG